MAQIIDLIGTDTLKTLYQRINENIHAMNTEVENTTGRQTQLETDMQNAKQSALDAASAANTAKTNADTATASANTAATAANTAKTNADTAASNANAKATLAQTATDNANNKVTQINQETLIIYKPYVDNYAAIATTYPTPQLGWTTQTKDTHTRYRWNGTGWINIGVYSDDKTGDMGQIPESNIVDAIKADRALLASKANQSDLNTTNTNVALKANQSALDTEVTNRTNAVATEKSERQAEIAVERSRINSFTALSSGSTTGDAELIDARVGSDGITYANAGGAIRGQINNLKSNCLNWSSFTATVTTTIYAKTGDVFIINVTSLLATLTVLVNPYVAGDTYLDITTPGIYTFTAPKNGYIRLNSGSNAFNAKIALFTRFDTDITNINNTINSISNTVGTHTANISTNTNSINDLKNVALNWSNAITVTTTTNITGTVGDKFLIRVSNVPPTGDVTVFTNPYVTGDALLDIKTGGVYEFIPSKNGLIRVLITGGANVYIAKESRYDSIPNSKWYGSKTIISGDSIALGALQANPTGEGLLYVNKPFGVYACDKLGMQFVQNYAISGLNISKIYSSDSSILSYMNTFDTTADLVICSIGTNDWYNNCPIGTFLENNDYSFHGALNKLYSYLMSIYSKKNIIVCTPTKRGTAVVGNNVVNTLGLTLKDYRDAIIKNAEYFGIPVCDMWGKSLLNPSYNPSLFRDALHPEQAGHDIMGEMLVGELKRIKY